MIVQININDITKILPHRYPFLLVDKIIDLQINDLNNYSFSNTDISKDSLESKEYIIGVKNVTYNEPHFMGHFPEIPVMPGVLILEAMAQLSAILISYKINATAKEKLVYLTSIENAKFRKVVIPGDALVLKAQIKQSKFNFWKFSATATVDDCLVAEGLFTAMAKDKTL